MQWIQAAEAADIPQREARLISFGDLTIAIFNVGDHFYAIDNRCPVRGCSLADGELIGTTVTCPEHHWRVCLQTGLVTKPVVEGTPQVRTYPVKVEHGSLFVGIKQELVAA